MSRLVRPATVLLAVLLCARCAVAGAKGIAPGDKVRVSIGPAPVHRGEKVVAQAQAGTVLEAQKVRGAWVAVTLRSDGDSVEGWVHSRHLTPVAEPPEKPPEEPPEEKPEEKPEKPRPSPAYPDAPELEAEPSRVGSLARFRGHEGVVAAVACLPDGRLAVSCGTDGTVRLWEVATAKERRVFRGHEGAVTCLAVAPDGRYLLSGGADKTVRVWDVASGKQLRRLEAHRYPVASVAYVPGSARAVSTADWMLGWDLRGGSHRRIARPTSACNLAVSPDGRAVLTALSPGRVAALWSLRSGKLVRRFEGHEGNVCGVAFGPEGTRLATAAHDKTVRLWEVATGREVWRFEGHGGGVSSVAFSPHGARLLSGGYDRTVRLWDIASGKEVRCFAVHRDEVAAVAFHPGGRYALSASSDGDVRLWGLPR
ncbi:MAG: hypothetical protein ACLF0G_13350 [Candidatus Brocadiia bacterium]